MNRDDIFELHQKRIQFAKEQKRDEFARFSLGPAGREYKYKGTKEQLEHQRKVNEAKSRRLWNGEDELREIENDPFF